MKIVRDDVTVALDNLVVLCVEADEVYRTGAAALEGHRLAAPLASIADERAEAAAFLADEVRRRGDAPDTEPTEERVMLEKAVVHLKALVPGTSQASILESCLEQEQKIVDAAEAALALDIDGAVRERVERLRRDAASRLERP